MAARGYFFSGAAPRERNISQIVEASRAPLRAFLNQENFAVAGAASPLVKAARPATNDTVEVANVLKDRA